MITTLYAAVLGLIFIGLSLWVIRGRWKYKISLGHGNNKELQRRIRIHANFTEYVPLSLLLLVLVELEAPPVYAVHTLGCTLVAARLLHIRGLLDKPAKFPYRVTGIVLNLTVILVCAGIGIWAALPLPWPRLMP